MEAIYNDPIPLMRPTLPDIDAVVATLRESYETGRITSARVVELFEEEARRFTGTQYAVAVSSCTAGLMMALSALRLARGAEVVVPSFTFAATVEAVVWNGLTPVYVDCLPDTLVMDPAEVVKALGPHTCAICPVNVFGLPPDMDPLMAISDRFGIPLIMDSAQGLGASYKGKPAGGFGLCEVFSLSPSKVITAVEGGLATTNDETLARNLKYMRDYGKGPDKEEMIFNGLSARMSELHASVGLLNLREAQSLVDARLRLIQRYTDRISRLKGCRMQEFPADRTSSGNYFSVLIRESAAADRDEVMRALTLRNIECKRYFYPPVHVQRAFRDHPHRVVGELPNTWAASRASLALPLFAHMTDEQQDRICDTLESVLAR